MLRTMRIKIAFAARLACCLLLSALMLANSAYGEKPSSSIETLTIGVNAAIPNLLRLDRGKLVGDYGDVYDCIVKRLPYQTTIQPYPVARLEVLLEQGKVDVALMLTSTADRDAYAFFSDSVFDADFVLLTKRRGLPDQNDFTGWTIGTVRGTSFEDLISSDLGAAAYGTGSWSSAVTMLQNDRLDGVYLAAQMIERDIDPALLEGLNQTILKTDIAGIYVSKLFSKKTTILPQINRAISACL